MIKIYQCWITFGCSDGETATGRGGFWLTKKSAEKELRLKLKNLKDCVILDNDVSTLKVYK